MKIILGDARIMKLGLVQAAVESAMFIFVYMWTPTLSAVSAAMALLIVILSSPPACKTLTLTMAENFVKHRLHV